MMNLLVFLQLDDHTLWNKKEVIMLGSYKEQDVAVAIARKDIEAVKLALKMQLYTTEVRDRFLAKAVVAQSVQAVALVLDAGTSKLGRMQAAHALTNESPWSLPMAEIGVILFEEGIDHEDKKLPFFCKDKIKERIQEFIEARYAPYTNTAPVWREIDHFIHQDHALADLYDQVRTKWQAQSSWRQAGSNETISLDKRQEFNDEHQLYYSFTVFVEHADRSLGLIEGMPEISRVRDVLGRNTGPVLARLGASG